ncbi:hypothetical protein CO154_00785 [Candidatus Pacearchaeota archaeon CG_4_9_14_3_um_filter_31_7]|nr:MAG: hypothetical protein COX99_01455 [Candidatus Pacearchaeota archaeon CG_4_10_14_0_2_um_filter_31_10]PJA70838.1 MAG: hypothetical protein CO154_00785 [Candidatus Pacearchaeota archaeon CG_4_9_14_3_um_filter_31_7]
MVSEFALFISEISPLLAFILVTVLVYALLSKTGILGENKIVSLIIAAIVGLLFAIVPKAIDFTNTLLPIVAAFLIFIVVTVLVVTFTHGSFADMVGKKGIVWIIVIVLVIIFIYAAIKVSPQFTEMISNPTPFWKNMILEPIIFFIVFGVVTWLLIKK